MNHLPLVIIEHTQQQVIRASLKILTAARLLASEVDVLVLGNDCQAVAQELQNYPGIKTIYLISDKAFAAPLAETWVPAIVSIAKNYTHILAAATTLGKNVMPAVAAKLDVAQISEVIEIISADTFKRPIYAGNVIATVQSADPIKVMTVRSTAFSSPDQKKGQATPIVNPKLPNLSPANSQFLELAANKSDRPELTNARVVVSGGRGMQDGKNFLLLEALADKLNGAIGASRAAVDAGFVPNNHQVGQTGKIVAPELYIAVGISGAIQHLAGMKDSKIIVAINKDEEAPIFDIADYGLVGDLFEIIPKMTELL